MALVICEVLDCKVDHRVALITVVPTSSSWVKTQYILFPLRKLISAHVSRSRTVVTVRCVGIIAAVIATDSVSHLT